MAKQEVREKYAPEKVLQTWATVMQAIVYMNEDELKAALEAELEGQRRKDIILRLHRKFNRLRGEREMKEYTK